MPDSCRYIFRYLDGQVRELTEQQCVKQAMEVSRLDETMVRICLARDGVSTPQGKFLRLGVPSGR